MQAIRVDFDMLRGDTWSWDGVLAFDADEYPLGLGTTGLVIRSTIKLRLTSADPAGGDLAEAALGNAQVDSDAIGGIEILSATAFYVEFGPELTELFPLGELYYDVVVDFSADESYTVMFGRIRNLADVTLTRA